MQYTWCNGNKRNAWGKWTFDINAIGGPGKYKLEAYIPSNHGTTTSAHYQIHFAGGSTAVTVNQNDLNDIWADLGTYNFSTNPVIELDDATGENYVDDSSPEIAFDAIKVTYLGQ